ncbi:MAG TPA: M56 family metallopeptidase, partial [Clostridia bacterium]|nr:M56 family metallopeptidase [Clostridia bacterium]
MPATALHWFNPAVHLLARQLAFWQESACDEAVTSGESFEEKRFYSETIIRVIRRQACMKTLLTTSFYGGRYGMKRRIHAILEGGGKRVGAALSAIALVSIACLGMAFAVDIAPEATIAAQTGARAYVSRGDAEGAPMLFVPTIGDLDVPIAAYFIGTPVVIIDRRTGSTLAEWGYADGDESWAEVLVGGDGITTGISGWVPLAYLSDTPAELPIATLTADSATGHVNLYTLNDTNSTLINTYRAGTRVTLLGRVQKWYQIELDGVYGFVQREYLTMDGDVQARFDTFRPDRFYDIPRMEYQNILTFDALYEQKAAEYGGLGVESW